MPFILPDGDELQVELTMLDPYVRTGLKHVGEVSISRSTPPLQLRPPTPTNSSPNPSPILNPDPDPNPSRNPNPSLNPVDCTVRSLLRRGPPLGGALVLLEVKTRC